MINILELRNSVVGQYRAYVKSFLDIDDPRLKAFAEKMLEEEELWPAPLLQCNPGFKKGETIAELIQQKYLHKEMEHIFSGFHLHKHQADAIKLYTREKKGFVITSGTGSGKSLTYLGSIFNRVLETSNHEQKAVKAIIVYPMNALINSQEEEIEKFKKSYETNREGEPFPIRFGKYTGQESDAKKKDIIENPPDIILTNYMMLELLLTRSKESPLREAIFKGLEFLVFDELHWYRGRQGADVGLLIRRIKAKAEKNLVCIGTSATLSSGSRTKRTKDVAHLAKQLFDVDYQEGQIIGETLEYQITSQLPTGLQLGSALEDPIDTTGKEKYLLEHPLSCWMERKVALKDEEGHFVRGDAKTIEQISQDLAAYSQLQIELCRKRLDEFLQLLQHVNQYKKEGFLPFRVHQFIAQTGSIRVSLESVKEREITQSEEPYLFRKGMQMPLFPIVFNRQSGSAYLKVSLYNDRLAAWNTDTDAEGENEGAENGYLLIEPNPNEPIWDESEAKGLIPDSWIEVRKSGNRIKKDRARLLPRAVFFDAKGNRTVDLISGGQQGWFLAAPLTLDPVSGVIYNSQTKDFNKLTQIGDAGRSISTTILTFNSLLEMKRAKVVNKMQKVMSFTDNRQDAALQTGHFNDFIQQSFIRCAIYQALKKRAQNITIQEEGIDAKKKELQHYDISNAVFEEMQLKQDDFAEITSDRTRQIKENEAAIKDWLRHQLFYDLRRGWRHRLPNLEQCGLLDIRYKHLREECMDANNWKKSPFLNKLNEQDRYDFLLQFLNYFRSSFALQHDSLNQSNIEESKTRMVERLKSNWLFSSEDELKEPNWMRLHSLKSKRVYTQSIGAASALGIYLRFFAKQQGMQFERKEVEEELDNILDCLDDSREGLGYIHKNESLCEIPLYRLKLETVLWTLGNGESMVLDEVRNRTAKDRAVNINPYFKELYQEIPETLKSMIADEHTGQIDATDRQEIETKFRNAEIRALYCSPTMELGIDINELSVVHMRNVPPSPANYAQRSGRAGRKGQGALILTFCSKHSAHDQHFFNNKLEMISGKVIPQKLDLCNPELLRSHLQAIYLEACQLNNLNQSLSELLEIEKEGLPLQKEIQLKLQLNEIQREEIATYFYKVIEGLLPELEKKSWYTSHWVEDCIRNVPKAFDASCRRWREMYTDADQAKAVATKELRSPHLAKKNQEWKEANMMLHQSQCKLDLLRNKVNKQDFSEFYPFRYLASEGFLPGYNFTRLPVRIFLDKGKQGGTYLSRPRMQAINEFGPENVIYQKGTKWQVKRMQLPPSREELIIQEAKIEKNTGYFSLGKHSKQAFSEVAIDNRKSTEIISNLLELEDAGAFANERISCQEDERVKKGFEIQTYFSHSGDLTRMKRLEIHDGEDHLVNLHYLAAADIYQVNTKWKKSRKKEEQDTGFLIHSLSGYWKNERQKQEATEEERELIKTVKLFTSITADCVYLEPLRNLSLDRAGVITFMFTLKKSIEIQFQVEPQEIACELMGEHEAPNILFYEAAEGSLGVLSRLVEDPNQFRKLIAEACQLCSFEKGEDIHPKRQEHRASYEDLLSYYNQRHHKEIDRFLIKNALVLLQSSNYKVGLNNGFESYDTQYQALRRKLSHHAIDQKDVLDYLYQEKLCLPDKVNHRLGGQYPEFGFFYKPTTAILFPKEEEVRQKKGKKKYLSIEELKRKAFEVIVYNGAIENEELIKQHPDVFTKQQA